MVLIQEESENLERIELDPIADVRQPTAEVSHDGGEMRLNVVRGHPRKQSAEEGAEGVTDGRVGVDESPENRTNQFGEIGNQ